MLLLDRKYIKRYLDKISNKIVYKILFVLFGKFMGILIVLDFIFKILCLVRFRKRNVRINCF